METINLPNDIIDIIVSYLDLDVQWKLIDQSQWNGIWKL